MGVITCKNEMHGNNTGWEKNTGNIQSRFLYKFDLMLLEVDSR